MSATATSPAVKNHGRGGRKKAPNYESGTGSNERSVVDLYLGDIGKIPLLTPGQEVELAAKIKAGDSKARDLMIRSNLRLVVKIAHDYVNFGLPLADLISEGNLGLIKAVERFDPNKGGKLSTYASWWIKQSIKRALANQSKTIRLPVHVAEKLSKIRKAIALLQAELGRDPTDDELAAEVKLPLHKLAHLRTVSVQPASLDAPVGEEENATLGELIGDDDANTPAEFLLEKSMQENVRNTINQLDHREAEVIKLRFGLDGNGPRTLSEIGKKFGVTRERIRQLQGVALSEIRRTISALEKQSTAAELDKERLEAMKMKALQDFVNGSRRPDKDFPMAG
jgi:RNA polymerase primary sigma factor